MTPWWLLIHSRLNMVAGDQLAPSGAGAYPAIIVIYGGPHQVISHRCLPSRSSAVVQANHIQLTWQSLSWIGWVSTYGIYVSFTFNALWVVGSINDISFRKPLTWIQQQITLTDSECTCSGDNNQSLIELLSAYTRSPIGGRPSADIMMTSINVPWQPT